MENNIDDREIKHSKVLYYEPEFDDIRNNPNKIWMKYDERIRKTLKVMAYWKNFDKEELYQQAYLYFIELCKIYTPFYMGNFIPFDRFLFKNLIIKLRAYIQNYYLKHKREQPTEISERTATSTTGKNDVNDMENKIFVDQLYSLVNERQAKILELTFKGYKQQEIGLALDISQSRVSVIKNRTIKKLKKLLENKDNL
jgi:RNA polymerase sigma factor (sigma-70 family)